jgi:hypothetical protein
MNTDRQCVPATTGSATDLASPEEAVNAVRECLAYSATLRSLLLLVDLGVPDTLAQTPEDVEDLAVKVGASADALRRILRLVSSYGFFIEEPDGRFRHSALSVVLRADHPLSIQPTLRFAATPLSRSILEELKHTLRTGQSAVEIVAPGGLFSYLSSHPEEARIFDQAMTTKSRVASDAILKAYDFSTFQSIADIGGGRGHLLCAVLDSAPSTRGILFDLPHVINADAGLASSRLSLQPGDFFRDPLPSCDAYLLMNVIHDWSDKKAMQILAAIRAAAPRTARLLVLEAELPPGPERSYAKYLDFGMLGWTGGRERTAPQYQQLLAAARFKLMRVVPVNAELSLFEAAAA